MLLKDIFLDVDYKLINGNLDIDINNISIDSRDIINNSAFFCIRGTKTDGHNFIDSAINNGAKCIVIDKDIEFKYKKNFISIIKVKNIREVLSFCAANFFNRPANNLNLIGITGTNGKTSTTYLVKKILMSCEKKVGLIGTLDARINDNKIDLYYSTPTTPDAIDLQKIFSFMKKKDVKDIVMEVSSHALYLHKTDCINFKISAFTNITQDHLDFHKDMQSYLNAKSLLFKNCQIGIINIDDDSSDYIIKKNSCDFITFGIDKKAEFRAKNIILKNNCVNFDVDINNKSENFNVQIPGKFTVYNSLCAIAIAHTFGVEINIIKKILNSKINIPGRVQRISSEKFNIIIDYAHSPDSLKNILKTVREFTKKKLICVFGCGGDRDHLKRPIMGKIASEYCDYCILTSDNPRTENPEKIIDEIENGFNKQKSSCEKITDRYYAIKKAIELLESDQDSLIIAGKGHENYQIFADRTIHFDDVEVVQEIISKII
jgi:UDP-N-acetylmuramoyl-L-alanyl-D-glutamate--2,6-diaminopimelate ligase